MILALPAFVAGASAAPALASDSGRTYDDKVVHVKICKEVKDDKKKDDDNKKDDDKKKDDEFKMKVVSGHYKDTAYVKVRDGYCKRVDLKLDKYYKQVTVKEYDVPKGYRFDKIKCDDGYRSYYTYDKCEFKKDWVKIVVINKVVKKHHDDD
jgi:hypothetical protein